MTARLKALIESHPELHWMRDRFDAAIAEIDNTFDEGRLYVVVSDESLLKHGAHYLIYGSEWTMAVLGCSGRAVLKRIGVPTILEIDLPLRISSVYMRKQLAVRLLNEWTRLACNLPDWSAPIDFSFCLRESIPAKYVVGHSHPAALKDQHENYTVYRTAEPTCIHCRSIK
jgi:hypothetical protein